MIIMRPTSKAAGGKPEKINLRIRPTIFKGFETRLAPNFCDGKLACPVLSGILAITALMAS
jgi:hypothetical protein